jgi:hypothetical protein
MLRQTKLPQREQVEIYTIISALTKNPDIHGKSERQADILKMINQAPSQAILLKLCNRIDNLIDAPDGGPKFLFIYLLPHCHVTLIAAPPSQPPLPVSISPQNRILTTGITCLARYLNTTNPVRAFVAVCHIISESGNVFHTGKRYRLTSGHAPIFSLYTYFGNSLQVTVFSGSAR